MKLALGMRIQLTLGMLVVVCASGCATKNHGRLTPLSRVEEQELTCREIDIELAKVDAFLEQITVNSEIDGRSVLGFLGDFGIGNAMERTAAEKSAYQRRDELLKLKDLKNCP